MRDTWNLLAMLKRGCAKCFDPYKTGGGGAEEKLYTVLMAGKTSFRPLTGCLPIFEDQFKTFFKTF